MCCTPTFDTLKSLSSTNLNIRGLYKYPHQLTALRTLPIKLFYRYSLHLYHRLMTAKAAHNLLLCFKMSLAFLIIISITCDSVMGGELISNEKLVLCLILCSIEKRCLNWKLKYKSWPPSSGCLHENNNVSITPSPCRVHKGGVHE